MKSIHLAIATALACSLAPLSFAQYFEPNHLYVSSYFTNTVLEFDEAGDHVGTTGGTVLEGPEGLAFGPDGRLYVANRLSDEIVILSGGFYDTWSPGAAVDQPVALAFGPNGHLYVSSSGTGRVVELDDTGDVVRSIGAGTGLLSPSQLAFSPDGHLLVVDESAEAIFEFDPSGTFLRLVADSGLDAPVGMVLLPGANERMLATSLGDDVVEAVHADGTVVHAFSHASLDGPRQLVAGPDGYVYVTSDVLDRVVVFDPDTGAHVRDIGAGTPLDGAGGVAFGPQRVYVRLKGKLDDGTTVTKFDQRGALRIAPGSGCIFVEIFPIGVGSNPFEDAFGVTDWVGYGFERGVEKKLLLGASSASSPAIEGGTSSLELLARGKREPSGAFVIQKLAGTVHVSRHGAQLSARVTKTAPPPSK